MKINKKKVAKILMNVGSAVLAKKGLDKLNDQRFMQSEAGKFPVVKAGVNGGIGLAGVVTAAKVKNEMIEAIATGVATAALMSASDTVIGGLSSSMNGMEAADRYLAMYDNLNGDESPVNLAGDENVPIAGADETDLSGDETDLSGDDDNESDI